MPRYYRVGDYHVQVRNNCEFFKCHICKTEKAFTNINRNNDLEHETLLCKKCTDKYNLNSDDEKLRDRGIAFLKIKGHL